MSRAGAAGSNRGRVCVVALATTFGAAGVGALLVPDVLTGWTRVRVALAAGDAAGFPDVLVLCCEALALLSTGWLWLLVVLVLRDVRRGAPVRRGGPPVIRRLVLAACGLSLAGAVTAPASAGAGDVGHSVPETLVGLAVPDRVTGAATHSSEPRARARPAAARTAAPARGLTVVAPGDSLWGLAVDSLPDGAGEVAIGRRWRVIYRLNAARIGPDPDLIRPGQRLRVPPPEAR